MSKTYIYRVVGKDRYKVIRTDSKGKIKEYLIDLKDGDMLCDCPGFYYTKKPCKHIKFILSQLKDKGGILDFEKEGDYERLLGYGRREGWVGKIKRRDDNKNPF